MPIADRAVVTVARCPSTCGQDAGTIAGLADWITLRNHRVVRIDEQYLP